MKKKMKNEKKKYYAIEIYVVNCDTDIPYRFTKSWCGGDRKSVEIMTSA